MGADAWPPVWANRDDMCRLGVALTAFDAIGWEGHHHYRVTAYARHWEPNARVALDFSKAGGLDGDVTDVEECYSEEEAWRPKTGDGWVVHLGKVPPPQHTFSFTFATKQHADEQNVAIWCDSLTT